MPGDEHMSPPPGGWPDLDGRQRNRERRGPASCSRCLAQRAPSTRRRESPARPGALVTSCASSPRVPRAESSFLAREQPRAPAALRSSVRSSRWSPKRPRPACSSGCSASGTSRADCSDGTSFRVSPSASRRKRGRWPIGSAGSADGASCAGAAAFFPRAVGSPEATSGAWQQLIVHSIGGSLARTRNRS